MSFNATITLNPTQVREALCEYLETKGVKNISHQDINFIIKSVEHGDQRDPWSTYELTAVEIKNIKLGVI